MDKNALLIEQLTVNYDRTSVLWDLSCSIPTGTLAAIVGPNGAGKSTLLKAALGLIRPLGGEILFFGEPLKRVRHRVAYVPQRESVDWDFPITVFELVLMGCYKRLKFWRRPSSADHAQVREELKRVGLEDFADRQISQLSGGQQQRAFLARALIQKADLYLMDEPFNGIDIASSQTILSILQELRDEGKTLLVVHHQLDTVKQYFDWVVLLNICLMGHGSVASTFTPELIQKTYGSESLLFDEAAKLSHEKLKGYALP